MDIDTVKDMYGNVILSGGGTLLSGIGDRLYSEIVAVVPPMAKVKVVAF
jgi:actin